MNTKIFFILAAIIFFSLSTNILAQEEILTINTYYPAPYGAYRQLIIGQNVKQPFNDNIITKARIGVTDDSTTQDTTYIKALLEIGGIAKVPNTVSPMPTHIGLYCEGDMGIVGVSASSQPAIIGYRQPLSDGTPASGPGVLGTGSTTGVEGEGTLYGVYGSVGDNLGAIGVYGRANNFASCGVVGKNNNNDPIPSELNSTYVGIYGNGSTGICGYGKNWGVWGKGETMGGVCGVSNTWTKPEGLPGNIGVFGGGGEDGYAGYFDGNVKVNGDMQVTKRATVAIPNIPVVSTLGGIDTYYKGLGIFPAIGDLIYVDAISIDGGLRIYADPNKDGNGSWEPTWRSGG